MKKLLYVLVCLVVVGLCIPALCSANASGTCGTNVNWTYNSAEGLLTISGSGKMSDYTSSSAPWFSYRDGIKKAVISNGVTSIGSYAFYNCTGLTSVTISYSVTSIGSYAFYGCTGLTSITIPASVTSIDDYAFENCNNITSIGIHGANFSIVKNRISFLKLENVTILDGTTELPSSAFYNCRDLTSITIPGSVTSIGNNAFYNCTSLTDLYYNGSIESWLNITFGDLFSNPNQYAANWYLNGNQVTSIIIPNGVTSIGRYTFSGCSGITSVTIPSSVTSIGNRAFNNCTGMMSITIPDSISEIGSFAFYGCNGLASITIPDSITTIEDGTFGACTGLTSITIPNSTTTIGYINNSYSVNGGAFNGCTSLTSIIIPDSVTSIGNSTFINCTGLTSITIPDSVTSIGGQSFYNCISLKNVTIPDSVTSIGDSAFYNCTSLTSVSIPDSVTTIKWNMFQNCTGLTSVTIPGSVTNIEYNAFANCNNLTSLGVHGSNFSLVKSQLSVATLKNVVFLDGTTEIPADAFAGCAGLETVRIPGSVTSIGSSAFAGCAGLTDISIPDGVVSIGEGAFLGCDGVTRIYAPFSLDVIGDNAFPANEGMTLYCYEYSSAESYGNLNGLHVELLNGVGDALTVSLPESMTVRVGSCTALPADIFPMIPDQLTITWTSDDESVVSVDAEGVLTVKKAGTVDVTLTVNGVSRVCRITAVVGATSFSLPEDVYVVAKKSVDVALVGMEPAEATTSLTWTVENSLKATVDGNGRVTGSAVGDTVLRVTDEISGLSASAALHVCFPVTALAFSADTVETYPNRPVWLTLTVTMNSQTCVNHLVAFSSGNTDVATVDGDGVVTPAGVGSAVITAESENGVTASCTVIVKAWPTLTLPGGLETIGSEAFVDTGAMLFVIPASVTQIADDAFPEGSILSVVAGSPAEIWARNHGFEVIAR